MVLSTLYKQPQGPNNYLGLSPEDDPPHLSYSFNNTC
jgi:hypothetical protein